MPSINILSREISELIAAGEVIERPSSVIKELVENSIDAGASRITVEIKRGGSTFIRITDDGCGIAFDDVPKAFLRHATSKITTRDDLDSILTLGFRGEALASVCAVSKTEVVTKQAEDELGTHYIIEGSEEILHERTGCPDGTTIIIRDLFYNVPARQKFMKKDTVEGNVVCGIVDKIALSHPEISFKLLRDNKLLLSTAGDGRLYSALFAVYGKAFAGDMIPVEYEQDGIKITGYTIKPLYAKANRSFQTFFVNNRYIKSQVCSSAVEEAYKGAVMVGRFPACVLKIEIPPDVVDVNVHPAKVEIRFSDDRPVYDCLFFAIKSALMKAGLVYDFQLRPAAETVVPMEECPQPMLPLTTEETEESNAESICDAVPESVNTAVTKAEVSYTETQPKQDIPEKTFSVCAYAPETVTEEKAPLKAQPGEVQKREEFSEEKEVRSKETDCFEKNIALVAENTKTVSYTASPPPLTPEPRVQRSDSGLDGKYSFISDSDLIKKKEPEVRRADKPEKPELRYIGEVFRGYIIAEVSEKIVIIDKHAAHERIIFERLKAEEGTPASQLVLCPEGILLSLDEADALSENVASLEKMGFGFDFTNSPYVSVKSVPTIIAHLNMDEIVPELAENFRKLRIDPRPEAIDDILHTMACKAAIKMNDKNSDAELKKLAEDVYFNERIRHCPHGRPVMFIISRYELEKQFRRIV